MFRAGVWGSVCSEGFTPGSAAVACKQMGFASGQLLAGATRCNANGNYFCATSPHVAQRPLRCIRMSRSERLIDWKIDRLKNERSRDWQIERFERLRDWKIVNRLKDREIDRLINWKMDRLKIERSKDWKIERMREWEIERLWNDWKIEKLNDE